MIWIFLVCSLLIQPFTESCSSAADVGRTIKLDDVTRAKAIGILRQAIRSDEFWPSMHAAEALTLAGKGAEVRTQLEPRLPNETDDQHRCGLARELVRAGDRSQVAVMFGILAKQDPYAHGHACESLYKVNEIGDGRLLRAALARRDAPRTALMAAAALGRWGSPAAMTYLRAHVKDADPELARIAAWVVGRIGDARDVPALRETRARLKDPIAIAYFDHALAALGDYDGLVHLTKNLKSDNADIRTYAAMFAGDARAVTTDKLLCGLLDDDKLDTRVRAAESLLVLAQLPAKSCRETTARDVFQATAAHPRYSEGDILALRDGSLLLATTEFIKSASDFGAARIVSNISKDCGRTWSERRILQENVGKKNVMSVTLCRLSEFGQIGMFYLVKNSTADLNVYLRISKDETRAFGQPILVTGTPGYHVMNNGRILQLTSGRLLAPVSSTRDASKSNHFVSSCFLSDDGGQSWRPSKTKVDYAKRGAMEPGLIELNDGRVLMILRTQLGHIAASYSSDCGDTWTRATPWGVRAPESPSSVDRIPSTGDLLLAWNDTYKEGAGHGGRRVPLTVAISSDEGKSWTRRRNIETDPASTYSYPSITFFRGSVLLSYYVRSEATGRISTRFRALPISMLYQGD